jgi:hypothetical protein
VSKELLFAAVVITLLGCNSEPTPGPTGHIVTITNGIIPGPGALWVFATDEQGALLSEAQIGPGQTVVLYGFASPDSVDISVHYALQFSGLTPFEHTEGLRGEQRFFSHRVAQAKHHPMLALLTMK